MASFASATVPLKQIFRIFPTSTSPSRSIPSFSHSVSKSIKSLSFCRLRSVELSRVSSLPRNQAVWEAPDDGSGSGSDYDEDEENDLDFESNWEEEEVEGERISSDTASFNGDKPAATTTEQYEEDLRKEIEQLLEPEERDILKQNATPNIDRISTAKWNPLHSLALAGQIHHMDMLLENGLHIDLVDKDGLTALHTAIIGKKEPVISHILRKGANPNVADQDGASPLHYAVQVGAMQTVKLLIKYNVDLNAADKDGWTPLHIAIQSRNRDIAKVLLVNGADKTRRNKMARFMPDFMRYTCIAVAVFPDGKTPLDLALCYGKDFKSYDLAKVVKNSEPILHPVWVFKSDLALPRSKSHGDACKFADFNSESEAQLNKTWLARYIKNVAEELDENICLKVAISWQNRF
ncbi:hypothetical protein RHSIM_Rhsim10G0026300 [Rhododendron simsii]|uniref:Uncharacterized protein n=1 Tax=Rhododendron simsii TaxID=118357 RepID=A0A834GGZ0_RHOSS|nr:hypothetical protein RHSIM_Rhsim10G0026300 [Rhododendron simsii]